MEISAIKKVRITGIVEETEDARTFILEPLDGWKPEYQAGQFLTLVFDTRYGEKRRSYSIASSPLLNEPLSITVKKVDNGAFSRMLVYKARIGDILLTSGISGMFRLPGHPAEVKQYFFLAAGSGITPCFSLIKTILAGTDSRVALIYSNRSEEETIFYLQLQELQREYSGRFAIRFLFSNVFDVYRSRLGKWLLKQLLEEYLAVPVSEAQYYLCGPFGYMRMAEITLLGLEVPPLQIHRENFSSLPHPIQRVPPDTELHHVTIRLRSQSYKIPVRYPQTILAAAKALHIELPYSCEAGRCSSCIATRVSGNIWMAYNEVLTDQDIEKGLVLTCQGYPVGGDVEIAF